MPCDAPECKMQGARYRQPRSGCRSRATQQVASAANRARRQVTQEVYMQIIRIVSTLTLFSVAIFYSSKLLAAIQLNQVMTPEVQQKTGVAQLTDVQKKELETWLNDNFTLKAKEAPPPIYLQQNNNGGTQLIFSDGSVYEIAPEDRNKASAWLNPITVSIKPGSNPLYPYTITNILTGASVSGKLVRQPLVAP